MEQATNLNLVLDFNHQHTIFRHQIHVSSKAKRRRTSIWQALVKKMGPGSWQLQQHGLRSTGNVWN